MTIEELYEKYSEMCDSNEDCDFCKYNRENCLLSFGYQQGRNDAIDELFRVLDNYNIKIGNTPTTRSLNDIKRHFEKMKEGAE